MSSHDLEARIQALEISVVDLQAKMKKLGVVLDNPGYFPLPTVREALETKEKGNEKKLKG